MISIHAPLLEFLDLTRAYSSSQGFKEHLLKMHGMGDCVFTSDGRNALYLALQELNLSRTSEVITTGFTCMAVPNAIKQFCKPVFVDVEENGWVMDVEKLSEKISRNTKAIIVVYPYGQACDVGEVVKIARERGVSVIEDVAQALGGSYKGKRLGSFGDYSFFSFRFSKDITCFSGGALLSKTRLNHVHKKTRSKASVFASLSALLVSAKFFPNTASRLYLKLSPKKDRQQFVYKDFTLSQYELGLLDVQLNRLEKAIEKRRKNALFYSRNLPDGLVFIKGFTNSTAYRFPILCADRDKLKYFLSKKGIQCEPMYDYALANEKNSLTAAQQTLVIPVHQNLVQKDLETIVDAINDFFP